MDWSKNVLFLLLLVGGCFVLCKGQRKSRVTLDPPLEGFIKGQHVNITCTLDFGCSTAWVCVYRNAENQYLIKARTTGDQCSLSIEIEVTNTLSFTCVYSLSDSFNLINSFRSDPVTVTALDRPKTPTIALNNRFPVLVNGQLAKFTCAVSSKYSCARLCLHRNGGGMINGTVQSDANYHVANFALAPTASAYYTCSCEMRVSGKWLESEQSQRIDVTVTDHPRKPKISIIPSENIFVKGEFLSINCSVDFHSSVYGFSLYFDGAGLSSQYEEGESHFATFQMQPNISADYTCVCWIRVYDQWKSSVQSDKFSVTVTDRPPKPSIRLNEAESVYLRGETISVTCQAGVHGAISQFHLYQGSDGHPVAQRSETAGYKFASFPIVAKRSGDYWCVYQTTIGGRLIDSEKSTTVHVAVIDLPITPEISLNQNFTTVIRGELLLLICKAPPQDSESTFYLYKASNSISLAPPVNVKGRYSATFNITKAVSPGVEHYRCMYNTMVSGRLLTSEQSDRMTLTIIDRPLKPICLLELQGPAIETGQNITVNCIVPNTYISFQMPVTFHFYANSEDQLHLPQVTNKHNFSVIYHTVPRLQNKTGYYTCQYKVQIAGRWIESERSDPQRLVLSDGTKIQLILILGSAVLLFLLIMVSICSLWINNTGRKREESATLEQDSANLSPEYTLINWNLTPVPENFGHTYDMVDLTDLNRKSRKSWKREPSLYATIK